MIWLGLAGAVAGMVDAGVIWGFGNAMCRFVLLERGSRVPQMARLVAVVERGVLCLNRGGGAPFVFGVQNC